MNELTYVATVKEGTLRITDRKGFDQDMQSLEGTKLTIKIKKYHKQRSNNQNRFYHGNFIPAQIEVFYDMWGERYRPDQVHEWNKVHFFGEQRVIEATGEVVFTPASTTSQSTLEFEESLEKCRQWFRQNFEVELPFPSQQSELNV